jgi:hypothetical protein
MTTTLRRAPSVRPTSRPSGHAPAGIPLLAVLTAVAVLIVTAFMGIAPLLSPSSPAGEEMAGFPLTRAQADLAVVAAAPHPMGSTAQAEVETFLVDELAAMGLQPQVETETVTMAPDPPHAVWTGTVRTVVARVEGTGADADQAVLLAAHHDSVPSSPGAGDNGAGVVSVLAAMRVLTSGPPPRHDVIAAFVDGEEHEMLGSLALVQSADWMRDVRVVVNTEGVGNAGRVIPALTSPENGWVMREYLAAADRPITYSAFTAPLNLTGQGADLGRYQEVVPAGLELVVVGGLPAYHAGTDTAAAMDEGTLAEYGTTVVALARRLAEADLASVQAPDLVTFTLLGGVTVAYPSTVSLPLAVIAAVAVVLAIGLARRRDRVSFRLAVLAWLGLGLAGVVGILAATALWLLARLVDPRLSDMLNGAVYDRTAYVLAAVTAGTAGVLVVLPSLRRRCSALEVVAGGLLGWTLFALLLAVLMPTASYAVTWSLLAATVGFGLLTVREHTPGVTLVIATVAAVPAVLLIAPLVALYFMLAARFELMLPVATPLPMLWVVLGLTLVVPLLLIACARPDRRAAAMVAGVAVTLAATGAVVSATSDGPRPNALVHLVDADTGTARWAAVPAELDEFTGQVAGFGWEPTELEASPFHQPGTTTTAAVVSATPAQEYRPAAPQVTVVSDDTVSGTRRVVMELVAPMGAYALIADVRSDAGVRGVLVHGTDVPQAVADGPASVRVVDFTPDGGTPLTVSVPAGSALEIVLASHTLGLDDAPVAVRPRPASLTTGVHEVTDSVIVTRTLRLPG